MLTITNNKNEVFTNKFTFEDTKEKLLTQIQKYIIIYYVLYYNIKIYNLISIY